MHRLLQKAALAAALTLCAATAARADLFTVTVDGTSDNRTVSSNSLINLADDVNNQQGDFAVFKGQAFTARFNYAGLKNAVVVNSNADNSVVKLDIPSIGFTKTFDAANGDVGNQIEDFLKANGAGVVADFISVTNKQTLVGVTDGNPTALTAQIANEAFRLYGDYRNPFADYGQGSDGLRVYFNGASINTDVGSGYLLEGALTSGFRFTDHVALSLDFFGGYRNIEQSESFTVGFLAGLPIKLTPETNDGQPLYWSVTPNFHIAGGGSADQLSGGVVLGGGVTNLVGLKLGDFFLTTGQSFTGYGGQPVTVQNYDFETNVGQSIFKGSLALTYGGTGAGQRAFLQGGIVYTQFLDDAAVDHYVTPFAGVGLNLFGDSVFRIGYAADLGDGFTVHRGEAEIRFAL